MSEELVWTEAELVPSRDKVYKYLKSAILIGEFKAGERLIERELADKLSVSRTPIREALLRLESQGFVKTLPRKGVVVNEISEEEIMEIFTITSALEVLAVKLAVQKMNDETEQKLRDVVVRINDALDSDGDVSEFHMEIKGTLHDAARSPRLLEMIGDLSDYIKVFAHRGYELPGRKRKALEEHRDILLAACNREQELAEYLTRIHIENAKKAYKEILEQKKKQE
ncbi:MAG: GntR family transcriptional regulator [Tumebacillaceae bacterium]